MPADTPSATAPLKPRRQRTAHRLTDPAIKAAIKASAQTSDGKAQRLQDGGQLSLLLKPGGAAYWQARVRFGGRDTMIQLGRYPAMTLAQARSERDKALAPARTEPERRQDPATVHRMAKLRQKLPTDDSLAAIGREWLARFSPGWSASHTERETRNLEKDLSPWLGRRRVSEIEAQELLATVRKVEERGALDSAHRVLGTARAIWAYAIATGRASRNVANDLKDALTPHVGKHYPGITDPAELGGLLRAIEGYTLNPIIRAALKMSVIMFQRPGELRNAKWGEFDLDGAMWTVPAARQKREKPGKEHGPSHLVPLPRQAVAILRDLHMLTGSGPDAWAFPGMRPGKPFSENTLNATLHTLGYKGIQTGHGFRATARTILDEVLGIDLHLIEAQQAHAVKDANGRAYNRTVHLPQRDEMLRRWCDLLDALRAGDPESVKPFRPAAAI